jgi:hypothetical protein
MPVVEVSCSSSNLAMCGCLFTRVIRAPASRALRTVVSRLDKVDVEHAVGVAILARRAVLDAHISINQLLAGAGGIPKASV